MLGTSRRLTNLVLAGLLAWAECACSQEAKKASYLERADQYFDQGEYQEALIEYRNVLQIEDDNAHSIERVGLVLFELGQIGQSFRFLQKAKELSPESIEVRRKLAAIYVLGRQPTAAREEAAYVLEVDPKNLDALIVMGETASSPLEVDEAIEGLEEYRPDLEDRARFHLGLGSLFFKKGDVQSAERAFQEAAKREPDSIAAHLALGNLHAARRDFEKAEVEFKKAAEASPPGSQARIQLAEFYLVAGLPDEAKQTLTAITTEAPDFIPAWRRVAQIAFDEQNYDGSAKALDELLERVPYDTDALRMRGQIHLAKGEIEAANERFREAIGVLQQIVDRAPRFVSGRYRLAQAHLRVGEIEQAKLELEEAKALAPNSVQLGIVLAELKLRTGEVDLGIQDLETLVENQPRAAQAYRLLVPAYLQKRNNDKAVEASRKLVELLPDDARGRYLLGVSLGTQGKLAEAKGELEASLSLSPGYLEPLAQLVSMAFREGRPAAGVARVREQIAVVPQSGAHQYLLGQTYAALDDLERTETAYLKAVQLEPSLVAVYGRLANLYVSSERPDEALAKIEDALEDNPDSVQALMLAGTLYELQADVPKAQQTYERLLEIDANFPPAANNLAYIYAQQEGKLEEALRLAEMARQAAPDNPYFADTLGWILYKHGTFERALSLIKESAEKLSDNATVQFHLAMTNLELNNKEEAWQALNRALELEPGFPEAEEARRVLAELQ